MSTGCGAQDIRVQTERAGFLQTGEEKAQNSLTADCKYVKEQCRAARASLFSEVHSGHRRDSIHKQKHGKFQLNTEGKKYHYKSGQILVQTAPKGWGGAQSLTGHTEP